MPGKLYVVATPIGNLEDITERARRTLQEADIIAAEDTRSTQKLLSLLGIRGRTVSNHKFNERGQAEALVNRLLAGENIALVSDAGTPCISDPGWALVSAAVREGIEVIGVCGASAVVTALSVSGFELVSFAFYGFFPREQGEAARFVERLSGSDIPVSVVFESPMRIKKTLRLLADALPGAELCLCNDLTKLHERIYRGSPAAVLAELEANPAAEKGEYTLVIRSMRVGDESRDAPDTLSPEAMLADSLIKNGGTLRDAIADVHARHGGIYSKNQLKSASLRLKELLDGISGNAAENTDGENG